MPQRPNAGRPPVVWSVALKQLPTLQEQGTREVHELQELAAEEAVLTAGA